MNQPIVFAPTRPIAAASSICAIPATRVAKTSGAMIILMRRRKRSVRIERLSAISEALAAGLCEFTNQPAAIPATMAKMRMKAKALFMPVSFRLLPGRGESEDEKQVQLGRAAGRAQGGEDV